MRGAEAVLKNVKILGRKILIKERVVKSYRIKEIDEKLRKERTKIEARLLHKAKFAGIACPTVLFVDKFKLGITKINGKRARMNKMQCILAGEMLAALHNANIIHGDFTPANLIWDKKLWVIDFGLGFFSPDIEDKAIDILTMLKSIKLQNEFLSGYKKISKNYEKIVQRLEEIKKRARYA